MNNALDLTWAWLLIMFIAGAIQLAAATLNGLWQARRGMGGLAAALYVVGIPLLGVSRFGLWWKLLLALGMAYALVNAGRLMASRFKPDYLRHTVPFNVWLLYAFFAVVTLKAWLLSHWDWPFGANVVLVVMLAISVATGLFLLWRARWAMIHYRQPAPAPLESQKDLPTVTLAVTARNETHALSEMLQLAIKSDYPKLEILVLDDCSQDATAQVIRSFAHDGVRFVQGEVPAEGWLGKNYAFATLAAEASGDLVVFAGVDTHFAPQSISLMVSEMLHRKAQMFSVLPYRREFDFAPVFFDQLGNFWQLLWPITGGQVPISSPCWAIWTDTLRRLGGFGAYKSSILPEVHFARTLKSKKTYRFVVSDQAIGITTRKLLSSQMATAERTFYPALKRRPAYVLFASLLIGLVLLLPYAVLAWQLVWLGRLEVAGLWALFAVLLFGAVNALVTRQITLHAWWVGFINFPVAATLQLLLCNWSMLQYEFGEVNWKGRNVCYPILETIPVEKFSAQLADTQRALALPEHNPLRANHKKHR